MLEYAHPTCDANRYRDSPRCLRLSATTHVTELLVGITAALNYRQYHLVQISSRWPAGLLLVVIGSAH
jgi:hypothetical protein